jgi:hypothetical protein
MVHHKSSSHIPDILAVSKCAETAKQTIPQNENYDTMWG